MSGDPRTQAVAGALSLAIGLAKHRLGLQQEQAMAELKAGVLAHLVDALVSKRIDAVQSGFTAILATYADQARHFMVQQEKFADKELESTNPMQRIELRSRIQKLDVELAMIRADAKLLYEHMTEVLLAIGSAAAPAFAAEMAPTLGLQALPHGGSP